MVGEDRTLVAHKACVACGAGKAEEEGGGPKTSRGFFLGPGESEGERNGTWRSGWRGRVVVFSCVLVLCVCEEPGKKKGTSGFVGGEVMWGGCSNEVNK